jgi:hypothetical protein
MGTPLAALPPGATVPLEPPIVVMVLAPAPPVTRIIPDVPPETPTEPRVVPCAPPTLIPVPKFGGCGLEQAHKGKKITAAFDAKADQIRLALNMVFLHPCTLKCEHRSTRVRIFSICDWFASLFSR